MFSIGLLHIAVHDLSISLAGYKIKSSLINMGKYEVLLCPGLLTGIIIIQQYSLPVFFNDYSFMKFVNNACFISGVNTP